MTNTRYREIVDHYEACLAKYGDSYLGVDWPKAEDVDLRYQVMLDVIREPNESISLLDFGCGASHLFEYIRRNRVQNIRYVGLDISEKFIELCRHKYPAVNYYCVDVLEAGDVLPNFDYIVMNGVFTEKRSLGHAEMFDYLRTVLAKVWSISRIGLAFNVMSSHVDWERDDLFHLPLDILAAFVTSELSRDFVIRNDYGLYEYTTYVYRRR